MIRCLRTKKGWKGEMKTLENRGQRKLALVWGVSPQAETRQVAVDFLRIETKSRHIVLPTVP